VKSAGKTGFSLLSALFVLNGASVNLRKRDKGSSSFEVTSPLDGFRELR